MIPLNGKVLVAEDNESNQDLIEVLLEDMGLECDIAQDGLMAVEMYGKSKYDLVLVDEQMPKMSGTDAMLEIRKRHENVAPIIIVTASVSEDYRTGFISKGMDDFIPKPIDEELLYKTLKKHLKV